MGEPLPIVGDIVHYTNLGSVDDNGTMIYPPTQQAAIVTGTKGGWAASLLVFYEGGGMFPMSDVNFSKEYLRGHWSWPPFPEDV
jgi:hypothetical protein